MEVVENGITVRADSEHIRELAKLTHVEKLKPRTTPTDHNFTKLSKDDEPMEESEVTRFRSAVGKLLYIAPDRPDIQFVSQGLAALMQRPTKAGWKYMKHVSSYLLGTIGEGILLEQGPKGRSMLFVDSGEEHFEWEDEGKKSLLEVICDADYAGQQSTRRSVSSVQIYLNGNMMESYVRCQKSISLSSGESEYICMVGGCSEALFIQHCWEFIAGERALLVCCRSDSSAARALATRVGIGRSRHIAAAMLWLQEKTMDKSIRVTGVPTAVDTSDAGTKCLSKSRLKGLKFLMKMVDDNDEKIGRDEYNGIAAQEEMRKMGKSFKGSGAKVAMVIAMALLRGSKGEELVMTTQSAVEESSGNFMWMFAFTIVLATLGALSLCQAVRAWIHEWFNKTDDPEVIEEQEMKQVKRKLSKVLSDLERKEDELMMQRKEIERFREEVNEERKEAAETREELQEARDELEQLKDPARSGERWKEIAAQEKEKAAKAIDVASGWRAKGEESKVKAEAMMAKAEEMMAKAVTMRDEAQSHVRKELKRIRYKVEGLEWTVSQSGDCYRAFGCKRAGQRRTVRPCSWCTPFAIRGVLDISDGSSHDG